MTIKTTRPGGADDVAPSQRALRDEIMAVHGRDVGDRSIISKSHTGYTVERKGTPGRDLLPLQKRQTEQRTDGFGRSRKVYSDSGAVVNNNMTDQAAWELTKQDAQRASGG